MSKTTLLNINDSQTTLLTGNLHNALLTALTTFHGLLWKAGLPA